MSIDLVCRYLFPVETVHVLLYSVNFHGFYRTDDVAVIFPVVCSEQDRSDAGYGLNLIATSVCIFHYRFSAELGKVGMVIGMIHDLMVRVGK